MKKDERGSAWSVTINNPIAADEENISLARQKGWSVEGQKEQGENGTIHYQLVVKTGQVRFSAIKGAFPRAHIELGRNVAALVKYCNKEETRIGELPQGSDLYPSLQKVWDMFYDYVSAKADERKASLWADWKPDDWLHNFDKFVNCYIQKGYVLETIAVNPQIRSAVKLYGYSMFVRSAERLHKIQESDPVDRQTDRQTETLSKVNS